MAEGGPVLDRVLQFLLAQGGRVRDGELTERFRGFLEEGDPAKRAERCAEWKAALKACAVVKQDKGARFLVLKKKFRHLLGGDAAAGTQESGGGGEEEDERGESSLPVEAQPHVHDGEEEEEQQQQQEEVKKMDEEAEPSGDGAELPEVEVKGRGKEVEEAMEVEEKQEVEEVDKEEAIVEAEEMCEQEAPADCRDADPEASLSPSSDGGRVEGGGGEDAWAPPIGGHELVSASSETISEQSEQLQSMCSRAETEQEDVGSVTASSVTLEPLERKWMRGAAVGCADTLRQLLAQDPSLASHRDFTSGFTALHWAAKHGSVETATLVAEAGVDVNARSHGGYTALHIATIHSREEMVELLITTLRVRQDVRDYSGRLALHYGKARDGESVTPNPTTPMRADKRSSRKLAGAFPGLLPYRASLAGPAGVPGAQAAQLGGPGNRASWSGGQPSRGGGGRWGGGGGGGHGRRRWGSAEDLVEEEEDGDALSALAAAGPPSGPAPQSLKLGRKSSK